MKRPSWQFYPGDWQSNPKLRRCSHAERGIWLDVLCLLHDQDEYGVIRWTLKELAQAVNARVSALQSLVKKQVLKGADEGEKCEPFIYRPRHGGREGPPVTLIEAQDGPLWYSSRMVRDEHIRTARSLNEPKPKVEPKPTKGKGLGTASRSDPSRAGVSSSASSSSSTPSSPSVSERKHPAKKQRDERMDHPAIAAVLEIRGAYPPKELWDRIIEKVGVNPDAAKMEECWIEWRTRNYSPVAYGWLMDWYFNGIQSQNGTRRVPARSKVDHSMDAVNRVLAEKESRKNADT